MADVWGMGRGMAGAWGQSVLRLRERDVGCWNLVGISSGSWVVETRQGHDGSGRAMEREEREGMKGQGRDTHTHTHTQE